MAIRVDRSKQPTALSAMSRMEHLLTAASGTEPAAVRVTCHFFSLYRTRSPSTDRLPLGPCSTYLDAVVDMVTTVVGLDLAPDSHNNTRILDSPTCTRQQWAAVLRADNRIPVERYSSCAVGGLTAKQTVFERCKMRQPQVYLDHPIFPSALTTMGLSGWEATVQQKRWQKAVDDQPPLSAIRTERMESGRGGGGFRSLSTTARPVSDCPMLIERRSAMTILR